MAGKKLGYLKAAELLTKNVFFALLRKIRSGANENIYSLNYNTLPYCKGELK